MTKQLNVLLIAEAANPEWTSVPLLGWSHCYALSTLCNTMLFTQVRNREAIERFGWVEGKEFTAIDSEKLAKPLNRLSNFLRGSGNAAWTISTATESLVYPYFEYRCWKAAEKDLKAGKYDVVHRITPVSPTAPSYLAKKLKRIGVPFVVGPLNGGVPWPKEFLDLQHKEKEWLTYIRDAYKLMPGYRSLRKDSACIVAASQATKAQLPRDIQDKVLFLPENAIDTERFSLSNDADYSLPIRASFVGRLVPYKGADMAIEAMEPLLKAGKMRFDIYGNGPEETHLQALITSKDLDDSVTLHGFVPNHALQQKLVNSDIFVFPSVREFGGGVVLEAMALGIVPIIADYAGPAELVTETTGYKVPIGNREQLIQGFRQQLSTICESPEQLVKKRQAGIARIQKYYTWQRKAEQSKRIYEWLLGRENKPDFNGPFLDD